MGWYATGTDICDTDMAIQRKVSRCRYGSAACWVLLPVGRGPGGENSGPGAGDNSSHKGRRQGARRSAAPPVIPLCSWCALY